MGRQRPVPQRSKFPSLWHTLFGIYWVNKLCFGFSVILFWGDLKLSNGLDSGHWFWGTTLYLAVLVTVLGKAALISEYVLILIKWTSLLSCFP